jgi:hypothetical protein
VAILILFKPQICPTEGRAIENRLDNPDLVHFGQFRERGLALLDPTLPDPSSPLVDNWGGRRSRLAYNTAPGGQFARGLPRLALAETAVRADSVDVTLAVVMVAPAGLYSGHHRSHLG